MLPRWIKAFGHLGRVGEVLRCVARVRNWRAIAAHYLGLAKSYPVQLQMRSGQTANLKTYHDLVTAWIVFCRDEYHVPPDAKLIVDLGANIGLFSLRAAKTAPGATIVAVEPFPACFDQLSATVAANGLEARVTCLQLAVAAATQTRFMSEGVSVTQSNGLCAAETRGAPGLVGVDALSMPDLLMRVKAISGDRFVDFLKIDVEGAEHEFFGSLPAGSLDVVAQVGIEYHPNGDKAKLFLAFARQGLVCVHDQPFGPNVGVAHFRRENNGQPSAVSS